MAQTLCRGSMPGVNDGYGGGRIVQLQPMAKMWELSLENS